MVLLNIVRQDFCSATGVWQPENQCWSYFMKNNFFRFFYRGRVLRYLAGHAEDKQTKHHKKTFFMNYHHSARLSFKLPCSQGFNNQLNIVVFIS